MPLDSRSTPIPTPDQTTLDRIWRYRPHLPRAIAVLVYFHETEDAVAEALARGEREIAASTLASSYTVGDAFDACYAVPWREAKAAFARAMTFATAHPTRCVGERVAYAVFLPLLERLGYVDGLAGAIEAPAPPPGWRAEELSAPVPDTPEAIGALEGAARLVAGAFGRAYERGLAYGAAERWLGQDAPAVLAAIDTAATPVWDDAADPRAARRRFAQFVHIARTITHEAYDPMARRQVGRYVRGVMHAMREAIAAHEVVRYVRDAGEPVTPLAVAATLRALARAAERDRATRQAVPGTTRPSIDRSVRDRWRLALVAAQTAGFTPALIAACLRRVEDPRYRAIRDVVTEGARDIDAAQAARRLLAALGTPLAPPARARPYPGVVLLPTSVPSGHGVGSAVQPSLETADDIARAVAAVARQTVALSASADVWDAGTEMGDMARVRQLDPDPSALTAARIAARRLATATTMATDGSAATLLARYAAIEGIRVGTGASWEVVCATALRALVAQDLADATLRVCDPAGFRLVCAECELAERAGPDEAEAAEQALLAYRAEALRDGGTDVALRALHGAPPDEALTDAVLLLARARILERALDRRAAVRARALLAANLPDSGQSWYAGVDAPARLAGHFQDAIRSIDRALAVDERARPRSVRRLRAAVQSEALEWLAADVSVAEMLATRIAAVADDAASPFCA